ncbi:MAG: TRAP transporter substrate-binding protein [Desulfobacterales bacterium]|nr:TRAP transporter substrate-binding protein [Desulfobacterales bacterium]
MGFKQKVFLSVLAITLVALSTTAYAADKEKKIILKVPSAFSTTLPTLGDSLTSFKDYLESASGGNIMVKIYEPGKLMPAFEILDAVSTGKVNAGYWASGYAAGKIKAASFYTAIPFGQSLPYYIAWMYFGNGGKLYQEMYDQAGYNVKVFPLCFLAPETAGWFRKEINTPEDLKGVKIRFFGLGGKVLSKLGASVTTIPGGEIFPALEKGALDATEFSTPAIDTRIGFYKVAKYNYFPSWHQPATNLELLINKDTWNAMSPRQKSLIEVTVRAINLYSMAKSHAEQGAVVRENVEKHGTQNRVWSPEMLKLFQDTWFEVAEEEAAQDAFFKKVWEDYKAFSTQCKPYESVAHLPRPK